MTILTLLLGLACDAQPDATPASEQPAAAVIAPVSPKGRSETFDATLATLDAALAGMEERSAARPTQWLPQGQLAEGLLQRARLTGSYDDYARANQAVDAAFAIAPEGAGPFLTRASLNYSLHRLDRVEPDLARAEGAVLVDDGTRARILGMRAGLQLQQGRAADAAALYRQALDLDRPPSLLSALAIAQGRQGDYTAAETTLLEAAAAYHGASVEPLAWIALHRGIFDLDRDNLDQALVHYDEALAIMPGWWLAQEHVAEIDVLQGRGDQAVAMYQDIVDRTGLPEFMDAIAGVRQDQGDDESAQAWRARARQAYERQLALFPEAAAGHALQHYLDAGDAPETAVQLAEANAEIRPNAQALGLLAQAYASAGRDQDAAQARARAAGVD